MLLLEPLVSCKLLQGIISFIPVVRRAQLLILILITYSINVSRNLAPFVGSQVRTYGNHLEYTS